MEDDGESEAWRAGEFAQWELTVAASPERLDVRLAGGPPGPRPALLVRPGETRPIFFDDRRIETAPFEGWRIARLA